MYDRLVTAQFVVAHPLMSMDWRLLQFWNMHDRLVTAQFVVAHPLMSLDWRLEQL